MKKAIKQVYRRVIESKQCHYSESTVYLILPFRHPYSISYLRPRVSLKQ